ncbi:unnamed protein product [Clavelina lepadiformis]|uniref:Uncharacterized protein n=1 Tax=Clavelina lepadiformis TaxID=159417 RepID=A0ABP0FA52_CLALP
MKLCMITFTLLYHIPYAICLEVFSTTSEEVVEGDSVLLRCSYKNEKLSDTMFVVLWQKIDPITGNAFTVFNSQKTSGNSGKYATKRLKLVGMANLEISMSLRSDAGKYRCQITPLPSFEQNEAFTELTVSYPPEFSLPTNRTIYLDEGKQITLPCFARGLPNTISYSWFYKSNSEKETALSVQEDRSLHFVEGRRLRISRFYQHHEGVFRCEATNAVGSANLHTRLLLKRPVQFYVAPKRNIDILEGHDLVMEARASGIPNNITYKWFYEGAPIDLFGWSTVFGFQNNQILPFLRIIQVENGTQLEIKEVHRQVAGIYTCTAFNEVGSPARFNITLDVLYPASFVFAPPINYIVVEGQNLNIDCVGTGNPLPKTKWQIPTLEILTTTSFLSRRYVVADNGSFLISPVLHNDSGMYRCLLFNRVGAVAVAKTTVIVMFAPRLIEVPRTVYKVGMNATFTLPCHAAGLPQPTYTWYKDLQKIDSNQVNNTSLQLNNIQPLDMGTYRCQVKNRLGLIFTETQLLVQFPPRVNLVSHKSVVIKDRVNITCEVSGYPLPSLQWLHSQGPLGVGSFVSNETNRNLYISEEIVEHHFLQSSLVIKETKMRDFGRYHCVTSNSLGETQKFCELQRKDSVRFVDNITVSYITANSISLAWNLSVQSLENMMTYCDVKLDGSSEVIKSVECSLRCCRLTSLNTSTTYRLVVYLVNSAGVRQSAHAITATTTVGETSYLLSTLPLPSSTSISSQATRSFTTSLGLHSTLGVTNGTMILMNDVSYDVTQGCVKWTTESSFENAITSTGILNGIPQCVKVEMKTSNRSDWQPVARCVPIWSEIFHLPIQGNENVKIRLSVCWDLNAACGPYIQVHKTTTNSAEETLATPIDDAPSLLDTWLPAIIGSLLALSFVVVVYAFSYAHAHRCRHKMTSNPFDLELKRHRAKLLREMLKEQRKRDLDSNNYSRFLRQNTPCRSWTIPGRAGRN